MSEGEKPRAHNKNEFYMIYNLSLSLGFAEPAPSSEGAFKNSVIVTEFFLCAIGTSGTPSPTVYRMRGGEIVGFGVYGEPRMVH